LEDRVKRLTPLSNTSDSRRYAARVLFISKKRVLFTSKIKRGAAFLVLAVVQRLSSKPRNLQAAKPASCFFAVALL